MAKAGTKTWQDPAENGGPRALMGCSELPAEYQPKRTQSNWLLTGHCYKEGSVAALPTSTLCKLVQHKGNQRGLGCWLVVRGAPRLQERGWARAQGDRAGGIWAGQLSLCSHHLLNTRTSLSWLSRWQGALGSGHPRVAAGGLIPTSLGRLHASL